MLGFGPRAEGVRPTRLDPPPEVSNGAVRSALSDPGNLRSDGERCPTCHAAIQGRYCAVCGEKRPSVQPRTVLGFLRAAAARLLDADNRLYRSLWMLFARPGTLTTAYLKGQRRPYLGPLQLFVLVNAAFYLFAASPIGIDTFRTPLRYHVTSDNFYHKAIAQRWVSEKIGAPEGWSYEAAQAAADSLERAGADSTAYAELPPRASQEALRAFQSYADQFDRQADWLSKSLVFLCIPMLAGWFWLAYPSRWWGPSRRGFLPHVVQATHIMCIGLFVLSSLFVSALFLGFGGLLLGTGPVDTPAWLYEWQPAVLWMLYIAPALKQVHDSSWMGAGLRAAVTPHVFLEILLVYRAVLFFVGFYTV